MELKLEEKELIESIRNVLIVPFMELKLLHVK